MRDRVRGLERRQDALLASEPREPRERVLVADPRVLGAAGVVKRRMLGTNRRVVEARGDGMGELDVAVLVLQHVAVSALKDPGRPAGKTRGVLPLGNAAPTGLDPHEAHGGIANERVE